MAFEGLEPHTTLKGEVLIILIERRVIDSHQLYISTISQASITILVWLSVWG